MASQIGWIDFSPRDRDRVKRFMEILGMGGVMDELGIGMIRDNMSNKLFPGFSTLYTRAKYFFITPYILMERDKKQNKKESGKEYFQKAEIQSNFVIGRFYHANPHRGNESYFGKDKKDGILKRQPSEVYWSGILHYHLLETNCSLDQLLAEKHSLMDELLSNNRGDDVTIEQGEQKSYGCENISYDARWLNKLENNGLTLTRTEAETLKDRFLKYSPNSLPAALVNIPSLWSLYKIAHAESKESNYLDNAFIHFVRSSIETISNETLKQNLILAHDLALFLHGAHLAYNIQIWTKAEAGQDFINKFRNQAREWYETLSSSMINYADFNINECIEGTNLRVPTQSFLREMQKMVYEKRSWALIENPLCELVEKQERWNKKAKSRFVKLEKDQVIDEMEKLQWLGLSLLNYRYYSTLSVVTDIYQGLEILDE